MRFKKEIFLALIFSLPLFSFSQSLSRDEEQELDIVQNSMEISIEGNLPLYFADSETGEPIRNVTVKLYGKARGEYFTDRNGFASIPNLPDGDYDMIVSARDYVSEDLSFKVRAGFIPEYRFVLSRKLLNRNVRIVLQWGEHPYDLDLHFEKEGGYHISYRNMITVADGSAWLDRDDTCSYGPETVTVREMEDRTNYFVYVVDYTNRGYAESTELSRSCAVVKIYNDDGFVASYSVPVSRRGNRWNVCTIKDGEVFENGTVVTNY